MIREELRSPIINSQTRVSLGSLNAGLTVLPQSSQFHLDPGFLVDTLQLVVDYTKPSASASGMIVSAIKFCRDQ